MKYASCSCREASQEVHVSQLSSTHDSPLSVQCASLSAFPLSCQVRASKITSQTCNLKSPVQIRESKTMFTCISNRHVLQMSLSDLPFPSSLCHRGLGFICSFLMNINKEKAGVFFLHRRQEFEAFRTGMKNRSY